MSDIDVNRLDANESAFFKGQLEYIKSQTYDVKHRKLKALDMLPVSTEGGPWATEITWRSFDRVGQAKMIADYANDFPRVDIYGTEQSVKPKPLGSSYAYSIEEIRRAQHTGLPLEARRAAAAKEAVDLKLDAIAWKGDTDTGLNGLLNYPGISTYTVPNGAGGTSPWSAKTPDEILKDMFGIANQVVEATNGLEMPDTLLIPMAQYNLISTKRLNDLAEKTILQYFLENSKYIKTVDWLPELKNFIGGNKDAMIAFVNDSMHLEFMLPLPFEQGEPDKKAFSFNIPCLSKTGGVVVYYPASVCISATNSI